MEDQIDSRKESQVNKFKEAARDLDCDTDEKRWDAKLKQVVKHKPVPEKTK
ncbi:hypothetical protein [Sphingorhabdus contaminans]|uniref:hypothetical protein n=1 Tax=Sphingorhabdus contaminans TaxID=1343899 RepID=UPI003D29BF87